MVCQRPLLRPGEGPAAYQPHIGNGLVDGVSLQFPMPEGAKAFGDHLLIRHGAHDQAQIVGEAIHSVDGGFGDGRIIKGEVPLD
jgi:hypothetical protein